MITIDGTLIKTPSDYTVGIMDIDNAKRVASGLMKIDNIAQKTKLNMSWKYMTKAEISPVSTLIKGANRTVTVEYVDIDGELNTGTFYSGDLTAALHGYRNNIAEFKDIKCNIIMV